MPWYTFITFIKGIHESKPLLQLPLNETALYRRSLDRAVSQHQFACQSGQKMADLLLQYRGLDSTVPRDNAYALLGLATDMATSKFIPDYSKSTADVYKHLTREIMKSTTISQ